MDNVQFTELLQKALAAANSVGLQTGVPPAPPKVESRIDKLIPLPIGSKTITGILGTLLSVAFIKLGGIQDPNILQLLDWVVVAFSGLVGAGIISKVDRFIKISLQVLAYAPEVTALLNRIEQQIGKGQ